MEGALHNIAFLIRWILGWSVQQPFSHSCRARKEGRKGKEREAFHTTTHTLYYNINNLASRDGHYGIWAEQRGTGQKQDSYPVVFSVLVFLSRMKDYDTLFSGFFSVGVWQGKARERERERRRGVDCLGGSLLDFGF
jgi:hypothetical protein